jgi:hypothetical protein
MAVTDDDRVPCPECSQRFVVWMRIGDFHREVLLCIDCETLWLSPEEVGTELCSHLTEFLKAFRIDPSSAIEYREGELLRRSEIQKSSE